jgi:hypothetical protein
MSDPTPQIEQIRTLCLETAHAVVTAQKNLDEDLHTAVAANEQGQTIEPLFSIPQANLALSFGLDIVNGKRSLIPFFTSKDTTRERHGHTVTFSFFGVPEPPNAPVIGDKVQINAFQPAFFVSSQIQNDLSQQLAEALRNGAWDFAFPLHGERPDQKKVDKEADKIIEALTPENPERGMVVFSFDSVNPAYLLIRVTDKSKKDGVFVLEPGRPTPAMIYSFDDDGIDNIRYAALHQFILTLRQWLTSGAQPVPIDEPVTAAGDTAMGLLALTDFAENVYLGYVDALQFLSEQRDDEQVRDALPSFYDINDVNGELTYSVFFDEDAQRLRFSFGSRMRPDGMAVSDEISVVESKAFVRVFRIDNRPQVETKLIAPEFALTDKARQIVLEAMIAAADRIANAFEDLDPEIYLEFIKAPSFQAGVVILLSYKGKIPKSEFLVAWPGALQQKPRDFVFLTKMDDGKITKVEPILGLAQDIELDPEGHAEGVEITRDQYEPFHNAFHAVRMWHSRVEMS